MSLVRLDLKLQAKFLGKVQFCVSMDSNAPKKWEVALPDCAHVIQRAGTFFLPGLFDPCGSRCPDGSLATVLQATGKLNPQGKDSIELNARALSKC